MAYYNDPYAGQYGGQQHYDQPGYGYGQYAGHQQSGQSHYQYNNGPEYNAYDPYANQQQHQAYDHAPFDGQGAYRDEPGPDPYAPQRQPTQNRRQGSLASEGPPHISTTKSIDETSRFDPGEFSPAPRGPKTASNLRQYRQDYQGNLWTRGGRGGCLGRFICCTLMSTVFLIVVIILTLVLWLRPPSIEFGEVGPTSSTGSAIQRTSDGFDIQMGVNISVWNPNFFSVNFNKITAQIFYPTNDTSIGSAIGNGSTSSVTLSSQKTTNFTFPFSIDYSTAEDPQNLILLDLAEKCGIIGGSKQNLKVNYKITLGIQVLFVPISPSISNSFSFACPLSADDLSGLLGGVSSRQEDLSV